MLLTSNRLRPVVLSLLLGGCLVPAMAGAQAPPASQAPGAASGATAGLALATTKTCLSCHQLEVKRVGPAFQAVAQRYAEQPQAQEYLANAIRNGGRGRWGAVPMPGQPQVNQQEALQLAQWIISLR